MEYNVSKWLRYFSRASAAGTISAVMLLMLWAALGQAFDEERLYFYDPQVTPRAVFSDTEVSSVHFDLVGSLAVSRSTASQPAAFPRPRRLARS